MSNSQDSLRTIFVSLVIGACTFSLAAPSARTAVTEFPSHSDTSSPAVRVLLPVTMYYLERYYADTSSTGIDKTGLDNQVKSIIDASPSNREFFGRAVKRWKELSAEQRAAAFDPETVKLTADTKKNINLAAVQERLAAVSPLMLKLSNETPSAPSGLTTKNASTLEPVKYQVSLKWKDNSNNEDGFLIYRYFNRAPLLSNGSFTQVGSTAAGVTTYTDSVPNTSNVKDKYCYMVVAYTKSKLAHSGSSANILKSAYSNASCSYYAIGYNGPLPPDKDKDGFFDADDECPGIPGTYPKGCPDKDGDGVADKDDLCDTEPEDTLPYYDKGPAPKSGCPLKYNLRFMGMTVLNNSGPYAYPMYAFSSYNEGDSKCGSGEEPYLLFHFTNGLSSNGMLEVGSSRWCCGDGIDVKAGHKTEPDSDTCAEEYPGKLTNVLSYGQTVFPAVDGKFAYIDGDLGLSVLITLAERDWDTKTETPDQQSSEIEAAIKITGTVAGAVGGCTGSVGVGCLAGIASAIKSIVDSIFNLMQSSSTTTTVDADDLMGSDTWSISRGGAQYLTSGNGAYAFELSQVPTTYTASCLGWTPCNVSWSVPITMLVRPRFCLYREGLSESQIAKVCTNYTTVVPWPQ